MKKNNNTIYILLIILIVIIILLYLFKNELYEKYQDIIKSISQIGQDTKVIEFYKKKRDGYFIEIGANDGITISNTYILEKEYGWNGICIEPLPDKFNELVKNRSSININKAVYNTNGEILDFSSDNLLSGITKNIDQHTDTKNKEKILVETITLNKLLEDNNAPLFIEYLSIDTEGSEYIILESVDFNTYTFGIIHLEHNYVEPRRTDMRNLLLSKGYIYIGENQWDDEYIHSSLVKK